METTLSVINLLPSNKEQVKTFEASLKREILTNDRNALPILVQLKVIEKVISDILKDDEIDLHFLKELQTYSEKENVVVNGATLRQQETGVRYDYPATGDPVWVDLDRQINELSEKKKEREKFLQNIPYDKGIVDPDTGLFITRPPKSSKTKCIVKL